MEDVRKMLGWGQSPEKDAALNIACTHNFFRYGMKPFLEPQWLDDDDVGKLLVIIDPQNTKDLSDRLRNCDWIAHLILHHYDALGYCGPSIKRNKRIWLSAFACPTNFWGGSPYEWMDANLLDDPAIQVAFYTRFTTRSPKYDMDKCSEESSVECKSIHVQHVQLQC
ncbi:MAG: hypothetical protein EOP45_05480 [Sphingobacteriaceae bacterium]|nr:MAG: hypothetical protein EOP45_05480 [Sphingobacteriaceae bacterium]